MKFPKFLSLFLMTACLLLLVSISTYAQKPQFKALIFSKTEGFRHQSIPKGIEALQELAKDQLFSVEATEDASVFSDSSLEEYDVIIMLSTTGDVFTEEQKAAFQKFVRSGKGVVGIHSATDTEYGWPWYNKLIGAQFKNHPAQQSVRIKVVDQNHPATYHLPSNWLWTDELYAFKNFNENVRVLMELDETTYNPGTRDGEPMGMGDKHPIAWYHEFDGGRAFYTALGHTDVAFQSEDFLRHLYGGIWWAAKGYPFE